MTANLPPVLTIQETADRLKVSRKTIDRLRQVKAFDWFQVGSAIRITEASILAFIEARTHRSARRASK